MKAVSETFFDFDDSMDQSPIIHIVGVGTTGLRAVGKMTARIHKVDCIGVQLASEELSGVTKALPIVTLPRTDRNSTVTVEPLMQIIENSDLIFLVSDLREGFDSPLLDICTAVRQRSTTLLLVVPEDLDGNGQPIPMTQQATRLRTIVDGIIIVSGTSLTQFDLCAPKVFDDTTLHDYLIRLAIEKITDIITTTSALCIDLADVLTVIRGPGVIRVGIGIASGTEKGISATEKAFHALKQQGTYSLAKTPRLLCCITGSGEMTMDDYNNVSRQLHDSVNEDTNIKIGITHNDEMGNNLMVTLWAAESE